MRYFVCLFGKDGNCIFPEDQEVVTSIKKAKEAYQNFIREAFHGETVTAYKTNENYDDALPHIVLKKKTDWRFGAEVSASVKNRKKFLKHQYVGKLK